MATYSVIISDPDQLRYTVPFRVITGSDLTVEVNSIATVDFVIEGAGINSTQVDVVFNSSPGVAPEVIKFSRKTEPQRLTDFSQTSNWNSESLNDEFDNQIQIANDITGGAPPGVDLSTLDTRVTDLETEVDSEVLKLTAPASGEWGGEGRPIKNIGPPVDGSDAARLTDVQATAATGLPSLVGNANKSLSVDAGETAFAWDAVKLNTDGSNEMTGNLVVNTGAVAARVDIKADTGFDSSVRLFEGGTPSSTFFYNCASNWTTVQNNIAGSDIRLLDSGGANSLEFFDGASLETVLNTGNIRSFGNIVRLGVGRVTPAGDVAGVGLGQPPFPDINTVYLLGAAFNPLDATTQVRRSSLGRYEVKCPSGFRFNLSCVLSAYATGTAERSVMLEATAVAEVTQVVIRDSTGVLVDDQWGFILTSVT